MAVQNYRGFFTDFGSPGAGVGDEKPLEILNSHSGCAEWKSSTELLGRSREHPRLAAVRYCPNRQSRVIRKIFSTVTLLATDTRLCARVPPRFVFGDLG